MTQSFADETPARPGTSKERPRLDPDIQRAAHKRALGASDRDWISPQANDDTLTARIAAALIDAIHPVTAA